MSVQVARPAARPVPSRVDPGSSGSDGSSRGDAAWRPRRYTVEIPIDPELLPFLALMALAFGLRLWDLGVKALHHDESLHAVYSWYLYQGRGYTHDPMMHGPLLFIGNALAYFVLGANDVTSRIVPALLGTALVGMPWLLRHEMGRSAAIAASLLFAISPAFLYFSRFIRHDIYVDVFTLLMVVGVFRYWTTGHRSWFQVAVLGAALLLATKEDFYISGFIPFTFLVGAWFLLRGEQRRLYRARVRALGWQSWMLGVVVFLAINVVLYTTFFTNPRGICTALWAPPIELCGGAKGALQYWLDQHDFARGGQPWFYYLMLLPLYEMLPLVLAAVSLWVVRPKNAFYWFSAYWFVGALAIYSWAGEKMPWMLPQITLPLVLLAARTLGQWAEAGWGRRALTLRGGAVGGLVLLGVLCFTAWLGLGAAQTALPLDQQSVTLRRVTLSVAIAIVAGGLVVLWNRWGQEWAKPGLALGALAIMGALYVRTAILVNYDHPDTPVEPLIYVQSSPDVVFVTREIERIAAQSGQGKNLRILMDNGWGDGTHEAVSWPFEWYLRDYKNRRYFTRTIDPSINLADYPVLLAMAPNIEPIQQQLEQYTGQKYRLNWWFPEEYKSFAVDGPTIPLPVKKIVLPGLNLELLGRTLADPQNQLRLVKFLFLREPPKDLDGAREFYAYIHNDVPRLGFGTRGGAGSPAQAAPRVAVAQPQPDGSVVYGRSPEGRPVLIDPKNVAFAPDGRFYVVEGRSNRVTAFNPDGSIATSWGGPGQGDGQFQEPWGIAVAQNGDVYVSDTWNHRIQRFDREGGFKGKWGVLGDTKGRADGTQPGVFWGPRALAMSQSGELYVADTGNKRIQVFDLEGRFRRMFGGEGSEPGQLKEATGLALDAAGNLWVADAWNGRVQKLAPDGQPLAAFGVPELPAGAGWENTAVSNKPFLSLDARGRVAASFPDAGRVFIFTGEGQSLSELGIPGGGTAVGLAFHSDRLAVADAKGGVIVSFPLP